MVIISQKVLWATKLPWLSPLNKVYSVQTMHTQKSCHNYYIQKQLLPFRESCITGFWPYFTVWIGVWRQLLWSQVTWFSEKYSSSHFLSFLVSVSAKPTIKSSFSMAHNWLIVEKKESRYSNGGYVFSQRSFCVIRTVAVDVPSLARTQNFFSSANSSAFDIYWINLSKTTARCHSFLFHMSLRKT